MIINSSGEKSKYICTDNLRYVCTYTYIHTNALHSNNQPLYLEKHQYPAHVNYYLVCIVLFHETP